MNAPVDQVIIGYQVRIPLLQLSQLWKDEDRREKYLLGSATTSYPLSVDVGVWPESNDIKLSKDLLDGYCAEGRYLGENSLSLHNIRPESIRASEKLDSQKAILLAIGFPSSTVNHFLEKHQISLASNSGINHHFIGFDICDEWLLSGLMNCIPTGGVPKPILNKFASSLNQFGLFDRIEDANAFAAAIDDLLPEHAPFFAVSLYAVNKLNF